MEQRRDNTVTLVKAIGIILMVVGHVVASDLVVRKAIFTFHMPLFFIMSGYCFNEKYLVNAKQFIIRKIKGIYVPFVLFSLPFLAMHNVLCYWNVYYPDFLYEWKDFAWHTSRIVTRMSHNEGLLGTFWFLKELFWGNVIFYAIYRLIKKAIGQWKLKIGDWIKGQGAEWLTVIGLFALTEITSIFNLRGPYFTVTFLSVYAAFFIAVGHLWKKAEWKCDQWWVWVIGIASVLIEAVFAERVAMKYQTPLSLVYYAIPAIFGTMVVYYICRLLIKCVSDYKWPVLNFIGEHTLSVMALHFSAFKLVTYLHIRLHDLPIENLQAFPVLEDYANTGGGIFVYSIVGLVVPLCMAWMWLKIKGKIQSMEG